MTGIKTYTRFWGLLMFGSYSVINVIVLLNLLIAMMSNSYAMITEHSDTEWKFARTKLWMSYFEDSATLPPPFNVFPSAKMFMQLCGKKKKRTIDRQSTIVSNRCSLTSTSIDPVLSFVASQGGEGAGQSVRWRVALPCLALRVCYASTRGRVSGNRGRRKRGKDGDLLNAL